MKFEDEIDLARRIVEAEKQFDAFPKKKYKFMVGLVPELDGLEWQKLGQRILKAKRLLAKVNGSLYDATNED